METPITPSLLEEVVARIVEAVQPERIYLFGSQAEGTATKDSDVDLCVVADMAEPPRERMRRISSLFPLRPFAMDVFVYTPEEFREKVKLINSIGYVAHKYGRLLYERT